MRAVCLSNGGIRFRDDYAPREHRPNLIEVRVLKAGICETDLQLQRGYMGFSGVLGHEFVGVACSGRFAGQRVVGEINCSCHDCDFCHRGLTRHCTGRTVIGILNHDGAFADSVWVPEENLHAVPEHISSAQAVFTEPVAAACRIIEQVAIQPIHRVVVFGDGRLGNLCAQVLKTTGCRLNVIGKHDWKLQRLADLGICTSRLEDYLPAANADFVIDCTGSPTGFGFAVRTVSPCGTILLKTTVAAEQSIHFAPIVIDEVTVLGSRCGPFAPALQMIADGSVKVDPLISAEFPLSDAIRAFRQAEQPNTLKVLLSVSE